MSEQGKETDHDWVWGLIIVLALIVGLFGIGVLFGRNRTERAFERHGYVLINGESGEAVATVTPVFQEWGK